MRRHVLSAILALVIGLQACAVSAQQASPIASPVVSPVASPVASVTFTSQVQATLDQTMADYAGICPGVVFYLDAPTGQYHKAVGFADREKQVPLDRNARFQIGSNTKMMTATIILQLQEEGKLSVDDPLSKWLPTEAAALSGGGDYTLRQLLTHTSGIYDYVEDMAAATFATYAVSGSTAAMTQAWTPQQIIDYVVTYRASDAYFPPGSEGQWQYSNTNYILLGMVIEKLTGGSYADALQARILGPLGMADTELVSGSPAPDQSGPGYYQQADVSAWNLSQAWAAGAVVSTPRDMAVFVRALLGANLFQNPATLTAMQTVVQGAQLQYGLGLVQHADGVWGHNGQTLGFGSALAYIPSQDLVLVAWGNCANASIGLMSTALPSFFAPSP